MPTNLPPELQQAWTRVKQASRSAWIRVKTISVRAWAVTRDASQQSWNRLRATSHAGWASAVKLSTRTSLRASETAKRGWISFRDSWTKQDWLAGIKPLPPGMAGNLTAIAIVTCLVVASLVYGDYYQRRIEAARQIASGEHPSQQNNPAPATPAPVPEPVIPAGPKAAPAPAADPKLPQMGEAFIERFQDETLSDHWYISDGWSNGDHMDNDWRRSQVGVGPNGLVLTMETAPNGHPKPLVSAEVRTLPFYRYGYFEVKMKVPRGSGLVTGVFTYAHIDGATRTNEIDIEILGKNTRILEATIHENGQSTSKRIVLPFDSADGFHTFGIDWRPNTIVWYADGKKVHEESGPVAARVIRPQQFIIDFWGSTPLRDWVGPFDRSKAPWKLEVSCAAYSPTYTGTLCD